MSFRVRTIKHTIRRKTRLFFSFFFSLKFLRQMRLSAWPDGFFLISSRQPVQPYTRQSVSITVFCEIAHAGSHEPYDNIDYFSHN